MRGAVETVRPDAADVAAALAALPRVCGVLAADPDSPAVRLAVDDPPASTVVTLPREALELLAKVLSHLANGETVSIVASSTEMTTQEAADLLNVSRPYLIGLLDREEIEYRLVGKHRRIRAESLLAYRRADDERRSAAADELTRLSEDMGLL